MQRPYKMRPIGRVALVTAGLLLASSAITGAALADDAAMPAMEMNPTPLTPNWTMDQAVQQMRDEYQGGTIMPEAMTGRVRDYYLHIDEIQTTLTDGVTVPAWAYGLEGQPATVPGPTLRAKKGDLVRIHVRNNTTQPHSLHSHGITSVDELNDGVPHITGNYIMPGQTFTYQYVVNEAGTHWYHCHVQTSLHQDMGMYGALIVEDTEKPTWDREFVEMVDEWDTHRDPTDATKKPNYNYFVVNGKAGHSVPDMIIPDGEIAKVRMINAGFQTHSLHLHGVNFVITHKDGYQLPAPIKGDTLNIAPGETYDLLIKGRDGIFPWHDHNSLDVTDDGVYPGGMIMHTRGSAAKQFDPTQKSTAIPLEGEIHNQSHMPGDPGMIMNQAGQSGTGDMGGMDMGGGTGTPIPHNAAAPVVTQNAVTPETTPGQAVAFDPLAPAQPEQGKVVDVHLEAKRVKMEVAPGDVREVWTFNGQVPAPTIRVHQGDTVRVTLTNKDPEMEHGLDFHAGQMDSGTFHKPIKPGESETFEFKTNYPGVFYFHCSAGPVIMHIANGMFGAVIVDPPGYKPEGKEYVLIQNEWYDPNGGLDALLNGQPTSVAFNGVAQQYANHPLTATAGEKVRFYFVNAGINNFSAFHVIGEIFDAVTPDGNPANTRKVAQTVTVAPGGAVVADLTAAEGSYPILTHSMGDATQGALGILQVNAADGVKVLYGDKVLTDAAKMMNDKTYVSAADFAKLAGVDYEYDAASGRLSVAGKEIAADAVMPADGHGGPAFAWIRSLADSVGAKVDWNGETRTVTVTPTGEQASHVD